MKITRFTFSLFLLGMLADIPGQNMFKVDSLVTVLTGEMADTTRVRIYSDCP